MLRQIPVSTLLQQQALETLKATLMAPDHFSLAAARSSIHDFLSGVTTIEGTMVSHSAPVLDSLTKCSIRAGAGGQGDRWTLEDT